MVALPAQQITFTTGRVDGHSVLGRTVPEVVGALGRPTRSEQFRVRRDLRFRGLEVIFDDGLHASAILVTDPAVARPPRAMRLVLTRTTGLRESRRYRCDARGCFETFFAGGGRLRVIYGLERAKPYVGLQAWPRS